MSFSGNKYGLFIFYGVEAIWFALNDDHNARRGTEKRDENRQKKKRNESERNVKI